MLDCQLKNSIEVLLNNLLKMAFIRIYTQALNWYKKNFYLRRDNFLHNNVNRNSGYHLSIKRNVYKCRWFYILEDFNKNLPLLFSHHCLYLPKAFLTPALIFSILASVSTYPSPFYWVKIISKYIACSQIRGTIAINFIELFVYISHVLCLQQQLGNPYNSCRTEM